MAYSIVTAAVGKGGLAAAAPAAKRRGGGLAEAIPATLRLLRAAHVGAGHPAMATVLDLDVVCVAAEVGAHREV